ncbi:TIGR00269 family protein [Candidatus Woesearchaeota archaeon]|jgi:tRNA-5-methyluridine54 2-sulfurtransferase|nr:TIGR00269 family protein [Candidatus Woesearchaeota archaeon]MBT4110468.1 TIGR00269 family protein [Candidatus Woesearchaeota archaeon]MBT4336008.1 TIGR00269 family protein [Candidatus Woesearchaeota archaeon]MBT4469013.1 TIGR00269 family protein [Candidatus Woesearchaeota archaeon]MBT6744668.1 TIGR00269 family protein [Candidatus Woesearchaeota archaeon]
MGCNENNKECTNNYNKKIVLQHGKLTPQEFLQYFETKVFKTIKKYKLFERNEKICVAASGGKDSTAVLHLTKRYYERYNIPLENLFAIAIDEGIERHRNESLKNLKQFCKAENIKLIIVNVKDNFKTNIDESAEKIRKIGRKPCMVCGIWRRYLLNKYARENGAKKLITGHNLDDEAQAIMMNQFKANVSLTASLGPISGKKDHKMFVRRIKPLYFCTNDEVEIYCKVKGWELDFCDCLYSQEGYRSQIKQMLNEFEEKYPGTKHGIVKSFLEILPLIKEKANQDIGKIKECEICKEPANKNVCNACKLQKELLG